MDPSSLFSVNLDQMFGSSLLVNLVCIISSCVVATSKRLCVRIKIQLISLSIHGIEGFIQLFWVLSERNTHKVLLRMYEKCYGSENM